MDFWKVQHWDFKWNVWDVEGFSLEAGSYKLCFLGFCKASVARGLKSASIVHICLSTIQG